VKTTSQDIAERLPRFFAAWEAAGEDLNADHAFIANFVGGDEVLVPTYRDLCEMGWQGDPPDGSGWIYMHGRAPLTRESVVTLAQKLEDVATRHGSLFELLDVTVLQPNEFGSLPVLGATDA